MEDMAKPLYLAGKAGDLKFKRNIPARLQSVAGKTAIVERACEAKVLPGTRRSPMLSVEPGYTGSC
jgi:hypothetical protein